MKPAIFSEKSFRKICKELAKRDEDLKMILETHGYPPMWSRPNSFETLVHIILEQQVSLASALSALNKLKERTRALTPESLLALSDEELRACYVSRQKSSYIRGLASAIREKQLILEELADLQEADIRSRLTALKGIGNWTTDVYLMFVLQRADVFPIGDLAAVNALKRVKKLSPRAGHNKFLRVTKAWAPYRTVATMMLWHFYLSEAAVKARLRQK